VTRAALLPAAALAVLSAGAGCTKILGLDYTYQGTGGQGTGGHQGTAAATGTGGAPSACGSFVWDPDATCQGCIEKSCCAELQACDTGTPCAIVAACARPCKPGDDACLNTCINADANNHAGSGLSAYNALATCFGSHCFNTTGGCSFPVCASTFTSFSRACADCAGNDPGCCAAFTACAKDAVCSACFQNTAIMGCSANTNFQNAYNCETVTCGLTCTAQVCNSAAFGYYAADCNYCLSKAMGGCCTQFNACVMEATCYACLLGTTTAGCNTDTLYNAYDNCGAANCNTECAGF
jgi:hypothetical protein